MVFIAIVIATSILYWIHLHFTRKNYPPSPKLWVPILGYLPFIDPKQPQKTLFDLSKKHGKIYGLQLGSVYSVIISDVTIIREALKREEFNGRAPLYVTHGIMGGYGLICAEGPLWKDQRKLSIEWLKKMGMVKFGQSRATMEQRILNGVQEFVKDLSTANENGSAVDILPILFHTFGNVVNDFVFGLKYDKEDSTWTYLQHLQEEGVKYIGVTGAVNFLPILRFLPGNSKIIKFLLDGKAKTHAIYDKIIDNCRGELNNSESTEKESILKHYLMEKTKREENQDPSAEYCSDVQMRHILADLFGASLDTTLTTLRWILLLVAKYPEIQEKCYEELKHVEGEAVTLDNFDEGGLPYVKAVVAETQRFRSVVPIGIPHGTSKDTELNGYFIPKDTMIIPLQWAVHMSPENWTDPETFNPSQFIDENGFYQASPNLIPFQTGKRICIGEELARMLLYLHTSNILRKFKITLENCDQFDLTGNCGITLTPNDHKLFFEKRI